MCFIFILEKNFGLRKSLSYVRLIYRINMKHTLLILFIIISIYSFSQSIKLGDHESKLEKLNSRYFSVKEKTESKIGYNYLVSVFNGHNSVDFIYSFNNSEKCIKIIKLIPKNRIGYLVSSYKRLIDAYKIESTTDELEWLEKNIDGRLLHKSLLKKNYYDTHYKFVTEYASISQVKLFENYKFKLDSIKQKEINDKFNDFLIERKTKVYDLSNDNIPFKMDSLIKEYHQNLKADHSVEIEVTYTVDTLGKSTHSIEFISGNEIDTNVIFNIIRSHLVTPIVSLVPDGLTSEYYLSVNYSKSFQIKFSRASTSLEFKVINNKLKFKRGDSYFFEENQSYIWSHIVKKDMKKYDIDYIWNSYNGAKTNDTIYK